MAKLIQINGVKTKSGKLSEIRDLIREYGAKYRAGEISLFITSQEGQFTINTVYIFNRQSGDVRVQCNMSGVNPLTLTVRNQDHHLLDCRLANIKKHLGL